MYTSYKAAKVAENISIALFRKKALSILGRASGYYNGIGAAFYNGSHDVIGFPSIVDDGGITSDTLGLETYELFKVALTSFGSAEDAYITFGTPPNYIKHFRVDVLGLPAEYDLATDLTDSNIRYSYGFSFDNLTVSKYLGVRRTMEAMAFCDPLVFEYLSGVCNGTRLSSGAINSFFFSILSSFGRANFVFGSYITSCYIDGILIYTYPTEEIFYESGEETLSYLAQKYLVDFSVYVDRALLARYFRESKHIYTKYTDPHSYINGGHAAVNRFLDGLYFSVCKELMTQGETLFCYGNCSNLDGGIDCGWRPFCYSILGLAKIPTLDFQEIIETTSVLIDYPSDRNFWSEWGGVFMFIIIAVTVIFTAGSTTSAAAGATEGGGSAAAGESAAGGGSVVEAGGLSAGDSLTLNGYTTLVDSFGVSFANYIVDTVGIGGLQIAGVASYAAEAYGFYSNIQTINNAMKLPAYPSMESSTIEPSKNKIDWGFGYDQDLALPRFDLPTY